MLRKYFVRSSDQKVIGSKEVRIALEGRLESLFFTSQCEVLGMRDKVLRWTRIDIQRLETLFSLASLATCFEPF